MNYIKKFIELSLKDVPTVGGKNASLGQMIGNLKKQNIRVPDGFALTAEAYWLHITENNLLTKLKTALKPLKGKPSLKIIQTAGKKARKLIATAPLPDVLVKQITTAYVQLCGKKEQNCSVAVRSSATAEDLPNASFAGQQETYLNVCGKQALLEACRNSIASLFTDRAIVYRMEKGFDHFSVALSVGVQRMVRSDKASAGVMFTLDPETGFKDSVVISSSYGLGESVVKGDVVPDEFHVFKTTYIKNKKSLIKKQCGSKLHERVFGKGSAAVLLKKVVKKRSEQFSLTDKEIFELAEYGIAIEKYYSKLKKSWSPMDIEWAKDGIDGKLYIVQARPETIHSLRQDREHILETYSVKNKRSAKVLVTGESVGQMAATGRACVIKNPSESSKVRKGDVIVTTMTDPDWVPVMKKAAGIITQSGGRTCHAAIVSRELGIPAIVGAQDALKKIKQGKQITIDCSSGTKGMVYEGKLPISVKKIPLKKIKKLPTSVLVNIAAPDRAYQTSKLPVDGVGLARLEFIISNQVQVHPMACVYPQKAGNAKVKNFIKTVSAAYKNPQEFFVQKVAEGVGMIAAAFYPRPVLVRFSDFKSNEYRNLIGGKVFEPIEENPMIGLRGASRYTHSSYAPAFELECKALRYVREVMGFDNVNVMIPFVRTVTEGKATLSILKKQGLISGKNGLKIYMMCELPSNVILIEQFAKLFDAFSIGSNDLTQTTLSVDRDSELLSSVFDERDEAVKYMLKAAIAGSHKANRVIGICGQAPSDHPEIAQFLIQQKIDSLSLNADSVLPFLMYYSS